MTKKEVVMMLNKSKKVKLTRLLKLVGGFRYTEEIKTVNSENGNVPYCYKPATATKNIIIRNCDVWDNPEQTPDVVAVIEKGEKFLMCTAAK